MSKLICDICGTSYPETAKRCPVCGCVCDSDVQRATSEINKEGNVTTGYTYVKGGRFSKSNVKKRNKENAKAEKRAPVAEEPRAPRKPVDEPRKQKTPIVEEPSGEPAPEKTSRGLVITAVLLVVAIIAVVIYICIRLFAPISDTKDSNETTGTSQSQMIPCVNIKLDINEIVLEQTGEAVMVDVKREPANTTDAIKFESADETIATVNSVGKVTAVGNGTTKIIITCGDIVKELEITCQIAEESTSDATTDTTEDTTEETTEETVTKEVLELNRKDMTLKRKGEEWMLYSGTIAKNLITWSTDDEKVATISEGKVVAVGSGTTKVYAEYEDQKVSCIVRCDFKDGTGISGNGGVTEDGGNTGNTGNAGNGGVSEDGGNADTNTTYSIHTVYSKTSDFTMKVGGSYKLSLKDSAGNTVEATWTCSGSAASLSGSTVTGVQAGTSTVTASYNGVKVNCIVRVTN